MFKLPSKSATLGIVLAFSVISRSEAHELYIEPDNFSLSPEKRTHFTISNGDVDKSTIRTDPESVADLLIVGTAFSTSIPDSEITASAKSSDFHFSMPKEGSFIVGISTKDKIFQSSQAEFQKYLQQENIHVAGAMAHLAAGAPVRERYAKHARTYIQVGSRINAGYKASVGFPVEILLQTNPALVRSGQVLHIRATFHGRPLGHQTILGGFKGFAHDINGDPQNMLTLQTDASGSADFTISRPGTWYLYTVYMRPVDDGKADYESHYATVLFEIRR